LQVDDEDDAIVAHSCNSGDGASSSTDNTKKRQLVTSNDRSNSRTSDAAAAIDTMEVVVELVGENEAKKMRKN